MHNRDTNFGSELFVMRTHKGVTQAEVALRAGLGRGYYSQLENSKKGPPSPRLLQEIVKALDLNEEQASHLLAVAIADRCVAACQSIQASTPIAALVKSLVQCAPDLNEAKAARIREILQEGISM